MGYLHINNLYKDQAILMEPEVYALEKVHGTSTHISWKNGALSFFSGGEKHENFVALFDQDKLRERLAPYPDLVIFGEAFGGKQQGQSWRYGPELRFAAFDVRIGEYWQNVDSAALMVELLGVDFVSYARIPCTMSAIDAERDRTSHEAARAGLDGFFRREGVVLRPITEKTKANGERLIAKHKRDEERETKTPRVVDEAKLKVIADARIIAEEWVTPVRLEHVLQKLPEGTSIEQTRDVISAMTEDVLREAAGEIIDSREARSEIGKQTALLFKRHLRAQLPAA